ncbi:MAG: hypothetical protein OXG78_11985 [Chloroflexi bacterium]|nr:hypothetical protein [Chloroflexota bacterium]
MTSLDLNTYVRDNQNYLKDRLDNSADSFVSGDAFLSTTSNEFVDVDAEKLSLTLVTHGGDVLVGFTGTVQCARPSGASYFNVAVDGVDYVADDGIVRDTAVHSSGANRHVPLSFVMLISDLSAGSHTFKLRWKTSVANTSKMDVVNLHPQFWAKEV